MAGMERESASGIYPSKRENKTKQNYRFLIWLDFFPPSRFLNKSYLSHSILQMQSMIMTQRRLLREQNSGWKASTILLLWFVRALGSFCQSLLQKCGTATSQGVKPETIQWQSQLSWLVESYVGATAVQGASILAFFTLSLMGCFTLVSAGFWRVHMTSLLLH